MKSQQLDISLETFGDDIHITLSGNFFAEQIPNVRQKFEGFLQEGYHHYILLLDDVGLRSPEVMGFFLEMLNAIQGRDAKLILVFSKPELISFFDPYAKIFRIYPNLSHYQKAGFLSSLKKAGVFYSKRTGIRLSVPTALLICLLVAGWVLTLFVMLESQEVRLREQENNVRKLNLVKELLLKDLKEHRKKLEPLQQLGLLQDSTALDTYEPVEDWIEYLEQREKK